MEGQELPAKTKPKSSASQQDLAMTQMLKVIYGSERLESRDEQSRNLAGEQTRLWRRVYLSSLREEELTSVSSMVRK